MRKVIISKSFYNLNSYVEKNKIQYLKSKPFAHIVIKNFFNNSFLSKVLKEFPNLSRIKTSTNYNNLNEVKFANNKKKNFKKNTKILFKYLNSLEFTKFLQSLTSIKEKILPDPYLSGGGLHEIKKGGILKVHTDFNKHPFKNLDRRINVLIYLNKNWRKNYGGNLELWSKNMKRCQRKILPAFNTMVIFSTNDFTNHGHPDELKCPKNMSRKSIATYYFSKGRPDYEISKIIKKNKTIFKNRNGIDNDVLVKNEYIKNIFRNLKIYQNIKNLEKKYIRTGSSKKKRKN